MLKGYFHKVLLVLQTTYGDKYSNLLNMTVDWIELIWQHLVF